MSKISSDIFSLLDYFDRLQALNDLIDICLDQFDSPHPRRNERLFLLLDLYRSEFNCLCKAARDCTCNIYQQSLQPPGEDSQHE